MWSLKRKKSWLHASVVPTLDHWWRPDLQPLSSGTLRAPVRRVRVGRYSVTQRHQKILERCCSLLRCIRTWNSSSQLQLGRTGSPMIRKWFRVKHSGSSGSTETWVNRWEFMTDSTSVWWKIVYGFKLCVQVAELAVDMASTVVKQALGSWGKWV